MFLYILAPVLALVGGYLWALRGGNFIRKGGKTSLNRLCYAIPTALLIFLLSFGNSYTLGGVVGFGGLTAIHLIYMYIVIIIGHGVFMDCGTFLFQWIKAHIGRHGKMPPKGPNTKSRHQFPVTWIIGREEYTWPFWKRRAHNAVGMGIVGLIRQSHLWLFYNGQNTAALIAFNALGATHGILYEIGRKIGASKFNKNYYYKGGIVFKKIPESEFTAFGEMLVGYQQWLCLLTLGASAL